MAARALVAVVAGLAIASASWPAAADVPRGDPRLIGGGGGGQKSVSDVACTCIADSYTF